MSPALRTGLTHRLEWVVTEKLAATHIGEGDVLVFATPAMILMMEMTATECVQPYLSTGQTTVGIHVDIRHLAATPIGMKVTAHAELMGIDKRTLTFRVSAKDEKEQ